MSDNMVIAEAYYIAVNEKNSIAMGKLLDPNIEYLTPLTAMKGKAAALTAAEKLFKLLNALTIREKFASETQAMMVLDFEFIQPIGNVPVAALLTTHNQLITKIEMFYDPRPILSIKDKIFS